MTDTIPRNPFGDRENAAVRDAARAALLQALQDDLRSLLGQTRELADSIAYWRERSKCYEELRALIDGGSESMTHEDAVQEIKRWRERDALEHPQEWLTGCPECGMDGGCDCESGTWNLPVQPQRVIEHYEAALKAAFPEGAQGKVYEHWNEARRLQQESKP